MKKIMFLLVCSAIVFGFSGAASALPTYSGATAGSSTDFENAIGNMDGYYIWSNDSVRTEWSLRWEDSKPSGQREDWVGSIFFGDVDGNVVGTVSFDNGYDGVSVSSAFYDTMGDIITFNSRTRNGWDGIDFTLLDTRFGVLGFSLGGDVFTEDNAADLIHIGGEGDIWNTPQFVLGQLDKGALTAGFQIPAPVPEPATMLLLGTGLAGLATAHRRKNKKK